MVSNGHSSGDSRRPSRVAKTASSSAPDGASDQACDDAVQVSIPSDFAASRELQHQIIRRIADCGYNEQTIFAIKLALEEAMINAIKHGNKLDMKKQVHVSYAINPQRVEFVIEDEGPGFVREEVPDPTLEENICKCSGRGLLLIEAYMNTVEFSRGGRRLHMIKFNEPDVASADAGQ